MIPQKSIPWSILLGKYHSHIVHFFFSKKIPFLSLSISLFKIITVLLLDPSLSLATLLCQLYNSLALFGFCFTLFLFSLCKAACRAIR